MGALNPQCEAFWQSYLAITPDAVERAKRFYEVYQIGDTAEDADYGAQLIMAGAKTTTSGLLWDYEVSGDARPFVGALGLVANGSDEPVCIVEITWLEVVPLNGVVDTGFIIDYGEWGETAESWQEQAWAYYAPHCRELGLEPRPDMPLLCERFEIVYP
jgi:uncharacterized protein YhfF